jgi:phosphoglycolate phosphatase
MKRCSLLFDLDGTISDPLEGIGRSFNYALKAFGYQTHELPALAQYIGPPLDGSFELLTKSTDKTEITRLVAKYRERYAEIGYAENVLYPRMREVLETLAAREISMGICTTKREDFAVKILKLFGIHDLFRFISGGDIGIPKERQIRTLLEKKKIDAETVMIGDRSVDLVAAHRNGLLSCGVLWGYGSRSELEAESPARLLEHPEDLLIGPVF